VLSRAERIEESVVRAGLLVVFFLTARLFFFLLFLPKAGHILIIFSASGPALRKRKGKEETVNSHRPSVFYLYLSSAGGQKSLLQAGLKKETNACRPVREFCYLRTVNLTAAMWFFSFLRAAVG